MIRNSESRSHFSYHIQTPLSNEPPSPRFLLRQLIRSVLTGIGPILHRPFYLPEFPVKSLFLFLRNLLTPSLFLIYCTLNSYHLPPRYVTFCPNSTVGTLVIPVKLMLPRPSVGLPYYASIFGTCMLPVTSERSPTLGGPIQTFTLLFYVSCFGVPRG